jgi:hypothetical protein
MNRTEYDRTVDLWRGTIFGAVIIAALYASPWIALWLAPHIGATQ